MFSFKEKKKVYHSILLIKLIALIQLSPHSVYIYTYISLSFQIFLLIIIRYFVIVNNHPKVISLVTLISQWYISPYYSLSISCSTWKKIQFYWICCYYNEQILGDFSFYSIWKSLDQICSLFCWSKSHVYFWWEKILLQLVLKDFNFNNMFNFLL